MATATIDRNAVDAGDTITWRTRNGGHEATGNVLWATRDAVHVEVPGRGVYPVEWARVETVTSKPADDEITLARCNVCSTKHVEVIGEVYARHGQYGTCPNSGAYAAPALRW